MKVLIVVTHLLGTGHLSRILTLGRAFVEHKHEVFVVSGGISAPQLDTRGITVLGLPPLRSDGTDFTHLLDQKGNVAGPNYLAARTHALTQAILSFQPDIFITELYPFGRRSLTSEFLTALEAAQNLPTPPLILSSIRDILAPPSKPAKAIRADEVIAQFYDGVLVHSDPGIAPLETSWPVSKSLASRLHYTGFVAATAPRPHPEGIGLDEIVVSAGGGSVGQPIFSAAIEAARIIRNRCWRLLVGGQDGHSRIAELAALAGYAPVIIEPVRPDFRQMLPLAGASISMCGYNTAMDLLQCDTPAVLIPFNDGKEVEQSLRACRLAQLDAISVLESGDLNSQSLADALNLVLSGPRRTPKNTGFDGANRSVEIATTLRDAKR